MVSLQNPHDVLRWGFLFASLPILAARVMLWGGILSSGFPWHLGSRTSSSAYCTLESRDHPSPTASSSN
jgi:hypothetical protein